MLLPIKVMSFPFASIAVSITPARPVPRVDDGEEINEGRLSVQDLQVPSSLKVF